MRTAVAIPFAMLCLVAVGCDLPDAPDPAYPVISRTEPIVLSLPTAHPTRAIPAGFDFATHLRTLPATGGVLLEPAGIPEVQRRQVSSSLTELFGTLAEPTLPANQLGTDEATLKAGAKSFRDRCAVCHGLAGDGRGPNASFLFPYPRDYRLGKFKSATGAGVSTGRPKLDDLKRTLRRGVPGTSMPAFDALSVSDEDIGKLLAYVLHLSVRGEVEVELLKGLADADEPITDVPTAAREAAGKVMRKWESAQGELPLPLVPTRPEQPTPEYHESIRRGLRLFDTAGCLKCHEQYGKTDIYRYDVWGMPNRVRNLTDADRRWTRDAAELAHRVRHGIAAVNMPASPMLTAAEVADLAAFVRELPYPDRLPADVRGEVAR